MFYTTLMQSWTCSETPKTIIKRMLLQELQKPNWKESPFSKEKIKVSMPGESTPHQMNARIPSVVSSASEMKGKLKLIADIVQTFGL